MKIKLDPSKYAVTELPEGDYEGVFVKLFKTTSQQGNRGGGFQLEIRGGDYNGRKIIANVTVTEDALWKANQMYRAVTGEDLPEMEFESEDELLDFLFQEVNGHSVKLRVKHEINPRTSEPRANVNFIK